jgi:hypothetical protein
VSFRPLMVNPRHLVRHIIFGLFLSALWGAAVSNAQAPFTLTPSAFTPPALDPGDSAVSTISVLAVSGSGFDNPVSLTCTVTSTTVTSNLPGCLISPDSETPSGEASLTITSCGGTSSTCTGPTPPALYSITVTGTSTFNGAPVNATANLAINVVGVAEDYALSVLPTTATPSPVTPGNIATTTITVSPIGNYTGTVAVSCLSVTPAVAAAPYCTFNPTSVKVTTGPPPTTTLTITTLGVVPTITAPLWLPRPFHVWFLFAPGLLLIGAARGGKRRLRLTGWLLLMLLASGLILLPACNTNYTNNPTGLTTPKNTYTFTLGATDEKGNGPANSGTSAATVTLAVN